MFTPDEIIFSATTACNLHCPHCFVNRMDVKLSAEDAIRFLESAKGKITKVGFTGGEPFLYFDFILQVTKACVKMDYLFDQIMTNGDWWKDYDDLKSKLELLYAAGYDGKFGLSWDIFHNQKKDRILTFIKCVKEIFGNESINIQTVIANHIENSDMKNKAGEIKKELKEIEKGIPVYTLPQTFSSEDKRAWNSKKWFKDDYCQGPGNILFVHPTGDIAPCCGFANENPDLFIGNIKDDFESVIEKSQKNPLIKICFEKGLGHYRKELKKELKRNGKKLPGKCSDICSFCDFVCKQKVL